VKRSACHSSLFASALLIAGCGGGAVLERQPERQAAAIKGLPATGDDFADVPKLVDELADDDIGWVAWEKLRRRTGQDFGDPYTPEGRRRAADLWTKWLADRSAARSTARGL
jgi:hypothetical protein